MMASPERRRGRSHARLAVLLFLTIGVIVGLAYAANQAGWLRPWADPLADARAAYDRGDFATTARIARERLRATPNDPDALRFLARASMRLGRDDVAQGIYQNLTIEKMQSDDFLLLATSLSRLDQTDGARKLLREAIARDPENPQILAELARLLALVDQLDEARALAARLAKIPGWERQGWIVQGILHHELGRHDQSAEALAQALNAPETEHSTQPDSALRKLRARALLAQAKPADALETLAPLNTSAPADLEVPWLASRAHLQRGDYEQANAEAARAGTYLDDQPLATEPAPYVGAAACAPCHKEIHGSQQSSHHGATFALAPEMTRWTLPDAPRTDRFNKEVHHQITPTAEGPRFTTTRDGQSASGLIQYVFGSGDRGATPVGRTDDDGTPIEFRLSSYGAQQGWDVTTGHSPTPANAADGTARAYLGRDLDADGLRRCFECHTTDTHSAIVQAPPTAADHGIGCERCHGPGGNHVLAMNAAPKFLDLAIAQPRLATPTDITNRLCGRCHSPRGATAQKDNPTSIRFQADTLTWSRCYTESQGTLGCTSCHGPHANTEPTYTYFEAKCLACHSPLDASSPTDASITAANTHSDTDSARPIHLPESVARVVCPVNPANGCITCHMPVRDDIIPLTPFTDHWIRVHDDAPLATP